MKKHILCLFSLIAIGIHAQDPWKIKVTDINPDNYYGVTVANGMLGLVSSPEPLRTSSVVLAGSYDKYGRGRVSNFLNGLNMLNTSLSINGKTVHRENISNFTQELDMKQAMQRSSFSFENKADVTYSYLALRQLPYCAMLVVEITPRTDITIGVANIQETPDAFRNNEMYYNEINRQHASIKLLSTQAESPTGKLKICASSAFIFPKSADDEPRVIHSTPNNNNHNMRFSKQLKSGETYRFCVVGSTITSAHHPDPMNEAERLTIFAYLEGYERLIQRHTQQWEELWQSDIEIEGDAQSQQDIHSMIYHLYSFVREGSALSISPMGLSGLGYNGHIFWDADTWIFPALLMLQPKLAESLIDYRFNRLEAAKQNAFEHGYKGAMYPWESSDSGFEETPVWALSGTFEHHISGCVALAAWNYYRVTQDRDWLEKKGFPILESTANFWLSRAEADNKGTYHIRNVVAADEWAENVDDNAYTNGVAKVNLMAAAQAARILKQPFNTQWEKVASKLLILQFADGVTQEHSTYKGEKIKQADANLLAYPLGLISNPAQIKKDLAFYEVRVPEKNTPAMTQAIFSLLYARLGNAEKAWHFFQDAYLPNLNPPFRVIAETKGGTNPYFVTGAGGVLQSIMMGFGGLEITDNGIIQIKATLPPNWKKLTLKGIGVKREKFLIQKK
nr:glycoside hydrolase family 65 protein [uncultured Bacteroides sp.]